MAYYLSEKIMCQNILSENTLTHSNKIHKISNNIKYDMYYNNGNTRLGTLAQYDLLKGFILIMSLNRIETVGNSHSLIFYFDVLKYIANYYF